METIEERIIALIEWSAGMRISRTTQMWDDLGIAGLDIEETLLAFSKEFNVDLDNYDCTKYERDQRLASEFSKSFFRGMKEFFSPTETILFDLSHLVSVVEKGYWFDPE